MRIRTRAVWLPAVTLLATTVVTGAALSLGDNARATIKTARPGAWMASEQAGSVSHLGPDGVDATVELPASTGNLRVVQIDGAAYVTDAAGHLSRIDPAQLDVAQEAQLPSSGSTLVAGGGKLFAVDAATGVVRQLDPVQLVAIGQPVKVGDKLGSAVVDPSGVLWVTDLGTGKVVSIDGQKVTPSPKVAEPGVDVRLSVVGADVVAVNPATATATVVSDPSAPAPQTVPAETGAPFDVPEAVDGGSVLPIVTGSHTLTLLHVRKGERRTVELPVSGHKLGTPRVSGQRVYLPDYTDGSVIVIDIERAAVVKTVTVTGRPGPFEVLVDGSTVYVNDPRSEHAWTIAADGTAVPADKYDPDSPRGGAVQGAVPPPPTPPSTVPDDGPDASEPPTTPSTTPRSTTSTTVRERDRDRSTTTTAGDDEGRDPSPPAATTTSTDRGDGRHPPSTGDGASGNGGNGGTTGTTAGGGDTTVGTPAPPRGDGAVAALAAAAGDRSAVLSWLAPVGWRAVTGYVVSIRPGGNGAPPATEQRAAADATGITVRGLQNGRPYTFVVTAVSDGTAGAPATSNQIVPSRDAPGVPRGVTVAPGDTQVVVTWAAPAGNAVDGYVAAVIDGRGATLASQPVGAGATTATIGGLPNGVELRASVHATVDDNGIGVDGAPALSAVFVTKGKPTLPGSVIASVPAAGRLRVTWTPAGANGSPLTGYTLTASNPSPADIVLPQPVTVTVPGDATSATLDGLAVAHTYLFTVTATNAFGATTTDPAPVRIETGNGPSAPPTVTATAGYRAVTLAWGRPDGNGTGIAGFTVRNLNDGTTRTANAAASSLVWDGLVPGTSYRFDVWATGTNTVAGASAMTPDPVSPLGTPQPVVATTTLVDDTTVSIALTPMTPPGPALATYEVTTVPDSGVHPYPVAGGTVLTVTGLAPATDYRFAVVAVDATGGRSPAADTTITTGTGRPAAPAHIVVATRVASAKVGTVRVTFTWPAVPGATKYTVDTGMGGPPVDVTTPTYAFTTGGDGLDYTATVVATNAYGSSAPASQPYVLPEVTPSPVNPTCPRCQIP